jgi:hypothetical protein
MIIKRVRMKFNLKLDMTKLIDNYLNLAGIDIIDLIIYGYDDT